MARISAGDRKNEIFEPDVKFPLGNVNSDWKPKFQTRSDVTEKESYIRFEAVLQRRVWIITFIYIMFLQPSYYFAEMIPYNI